MTSSFSQFIESDSPVPDKELREALKETDLLSFESKLCNELQLTRLEHFDHIQDSELASLAGLSLPAIRRLRASVDKRRKAQAKGGLRNFFGSVRKAGHKPYTPSINHNHQESGDKNSPDEPCGEENGAGGRSSSTTTTTHLIAKEQLKIMENIGEGSFAIVKRAVWNNGKGKIDVAVKILRDNSSLSDEIQQEVGNMHQLQHPNLIRLFGLVFSNPIMMVVEFCDGGALLDRLRHSSLPTLLASQLMNYSLQISRGMRYLEHKRFIHRDLAARNVLITQNEKYVKIGDFGLMRALPDRDEHYVMSGQKKVPFAWCPPESLKRRQFSHASDVWSFGVTLWEMFTFGEEPWCGFRGPEILRKVEAGERLQKPTICSKAVYLLMMECWSLDPDTRPKFVDLKERLKPLQLTIGECRLAQPEDEQQQLIQMTPSDRIIVIEGSAEQYYWFGQSVKTRKFGKFARKNIRFSLENNGGGGKKQKQHSSSEISRPIQSSFIHAGHADSRGGQSWGQADKIDPLILNNPLINLDSPPEETSKSNGGAEIVESILSISGGGRPSNVNQNPPPLRPPPPINSRGGGGGGSSRGSGSGGSGGSYSANEGGVYGGGSLYNGVDPFAPFDDEYSVCPYAPPAQELYDAPPTETGSAYYGQVPDEDDIYQPNPLPSNSYGAGHQSSSNVINPPLVPTTTNSANQSAAAAAAAAAAAPKFTIGGGPQQQQQQQQPSSSSNLSAITTTRMETTFGVSSSSSSTAFPHNPMEPSQTNNINNNHHYLQQQQQRSQQQSNYVLSSNNGAAILSSTPTNTATFNSNNSSTSGAAQNNMVIGTTILTPPTSVSKASSFASNDTTYSSAGNGVGSYSITPPNFSNKNSSSAVAVKYSGTTTTTPASASFFTGSEWNSSFLPATQTKAVPSSPAPTSTPSSSYNTSSFSASVTAVPPPLRSKPTQQRIPSIPSSSPGEPDPFEVPAEALNLVNKPRYDQMFKKADGNAITTTVGSSSTYSNNRSTSASHLPRTGVSPESHIMQPSPTPVSTVVPLRSSTPASAVSSTIQQAAATNRTHHQSPLQPSPIITSKMTTTIGGHNQQQQQQQTAQINQHQQQRLSSHHSPIIPSSSTNTGGVGGYYQQQSPAAAAGGGRNVEIGTMQPIISQPPNSTRIKSNSNSSSSPSSSFQNKPYNRNSASQLPSMSSTIRSTTPVNQLPSNQPPRPSSVQLQPLGNNEDGVGNQRRTTTTAVSPNLPHPSYSMNLTPLVPQASALLMQPLQPENRTRSVPNVNANLAVLDQFDPLSSRVSDDLVVRVQQEAPFANTERCTTLLQRFGGDPVKVVQELKLEKLIDMGLTTSREQAQHALQRNDWNLNSAAATLLG